MPMPTFSLLGEFKAELYFIGPEEDLVTVSEEMKVYISHFKQVGVGITQAESQSEVNFVKPHLSTESQEDTNE